MQCAASSIRASASKISGATLSGTVSIRTAERSHSLVSMVWSNSKAARSSRSRRKWRTSNQPKITPVRTVAAVATFAIVLMSMPVSWRLSPKMKSRRFTRNLRLLRYRLWLSLIVDDDAIDHAGLAGAVIVNVHARTGLDHRGLDFFSGLVHVANRLAQHIADRI